MPSDPSATPPPPPTPRQPGSPTSRPVPPPPVPPRPVKPPVSPPTVVAPSAKKTSTTVAVKPLSTAPTPPKTPAPPRPTAQAASPTVDAETEVVIRTMQDDLDAVRSPGTATTPVAVASRPTSAPAKPTPVATARTASAPPPTSEKGAPVFPLPPRKTEQRTKVVMAPPVRRRRRSRKGLMMAVSLLLLVGGAGGLAWYFGLLDGITGSETVAPASASAVLPSEAVLIVQYRLQSAEDRSDITTLWSAEIEPPSINSLLAGDPRLIVNDPELTEFYYVVLEKNARPYLVLPQTTQGKDLVAQSNDVRSLEVEGWYVLHSLVTDPYSAALAGGSLADIGSPAILAADAAPSPLRLVLSQGLLPTVRRDIAGDHFVAGQLQEVSAAGRLQSGSVLQLAGTAALLNPLDEAVTNQQLLSLVPAGAKLVRLGASFERDLAQWLNVAGVVDDQILRRPLVQQFLAQLTTPYAYFTYPAATGETSLGLIIELPAEARGTLTLQEPALAEAMPALVPLILNRQNVAPVAFTEVTYAGIALRYANLVSPSQALDYAVTPTHLLVTSSRESMHALLDTVGGTTASVTTGGVWQSLIAAWGALPAAHDIIFGTLTTPALVELLPNRGLTGGLPFGVTLQPGSPQAALQAAIQLAPPGPISSPPPLAPAAVRLRP